MAISCNNRAVVVYEIFIKDCYGDSEEFMHILESVTEFAGQKITRSDCKRLNYEANSHKVVDLWSG